MKRLGYSHWVAQGGDWGAAVTIALAQLLPPGLVAAHVNWPLVVPNRPSENQTQREATVYAHIEYFQQNMAGYFLQQGTRPETIGYLLADTPAGQAMWLYERFHDWVDSSDTAEALPMREMLDDISLYWFTDTGASAARYYWENLRSTPPFGFNAGPVTLPMAATIYPKESFTPPEAWAKSLWPNLHYWAEVEKGGHFAAWEQADIFVADMRKAFGPAWST